MIYDITKKDFYIKSDIFSLKGVNAIIEAIKNTLLLSELEIPFYTSTSNIKEILLKVQSKSLQIDLLKRIKDEILLNEYVKNVDLTYNFKTSILRIDVELQNLDVDEKEMKIEFNINEIS